MLTLMLLRHAKSSWDDPMLADFDRPLNDRGRRAITAMRGYVERERLAPQRILCSPALRTRETLEGVYPGANAQFVQKLFDFDEAETMLDVIRQHGGKASPLLVVGHSPSIGELSEILIGAGDEDQREKLRAKYPTGALAVIDFEATAWDQIAANKGTLQRFVRPKDLKPA